MTTNPPDRTERKLRLSPKIVAAALIGVLATVFVFQNTAKGQVNVLFWTIRMPAWIWLLGVFAAGVALGSMLPWLRRRFGRKA